MKNVTNGKEIELRGEQLDAEQLDALSGGGPSLWDILGPAILSVTGPIDLGGYGGAPKPY